MSGWSTYGQKLLLLMLLFHGTTGYLNAPNPAEHFCSFQESLCGWFNSDKDNIDWARHQGLTRTRQGGKILTGPTADHTMGNSTGFYLYMETSAHTTGQYADFISDIDYDIQGARLTFWYYMHGMSMGRLCVLVWPISDLYPARNASVLWTVSGDQGDQWRNTVLDIPRQKQDFKIIMRAFVGGGGTSDIAIDDVTIAPPPETTTQKPTTTPIPGSVKTLDKCNFQESLCLWRNAPTGKIQWLRHQGETPTRKQNISSTGPISDHSLQSPRGYYLYMESSAYMQGDTADIVSPTFTKPVKLAFWYYMHGESMGSLQVLIVTSGQKATTLWSVTGEKGDQWVAGYADVPTDQAIPYELVIRATVGKPVTSDIAIDDVTITQAVDINSTNTSPSSQPPSGSPPDGAATTGANSTWTGILFQCNFDIGSNCGWSKPKSEDMPWQFRSDATPTKGTGANKDHTSGKGRFAYIETSVQGGKHFTSHTTAVLTTPPLSVTLECPVVLTFWYNMYGATTGQLRIRVHNDSDPSPLWYRRYQQSPDGDTWNTAQVPIPRPPAGTSLEIDFEATRGTNIYGDICIDDVVISQHCSDTGALPSNEQEKVVFYCDFEDICEFIQPHAPTDNFDWSLNTGSTDTKETGPDVDRTRGDNNGHYMYIETSRFAKAGISTSSNKGDTAILRSPVLHKSPAGCEHRLVFFYSMYGRQTGSLSVRIKGKADALWSLSGQQCNDGKTWKEAVIFLPRDVDQQFEIVGVRGDGYLGDIGIDDISVELLCTDTTMSVTQSTSMMKSSSSQPSTPTSTTKTASTTTTTTTTTNTPTTSTSRTTSTPSSRTTTSTSTATTTRTTETSTATTPTTETLTSTATTTPTTETSTSTATTTPTITSTATATTTPTTETSTATTTPTTETSTSTATTTSTATATTTPTTTPTTTSTATTTPTTIQTTTTPTISTSTTLKTTTIVTRKSSSSKPSTTQPSSTTEATTTPSASPSQTPTSATSTTVATSTTSASTSSTTETATTSSSTSTTTQTSSSNTIKTSPTTIETQTSSTISSAPTSSSSEPHSTTSTVTPSSSQPSTTTTTTTAPSDSTNSLPPESKPTTTLIPKATTLSTTVSEAETSTEQVATATVIPPSSSPSSSSAPNSVRTFPTPTISSVRPTNGGRAPSPPPHVTTSHATQVPAGPLPGEGDSSTSGNMGPDVQANPSTGAPGVHQSQKGSKDSTPTIAAAAAGGGAMFVIVLALFIVWRKKRRPSQKGRTIPVDDNLSYHSLDHGLEFDNVGYEQFIHTQIQQQASERDSGLGDVDTSSMQPKFSDTGASIV